MERLNPKQLAGIVSDVVNPMGFKNEEFIEQMNREHRTIQQKFTRLVLEWLEHVASDEYYTDPRNEDSKTVAKRMLKGFKAELVKEGYPEKEVESEHYNPSKFLGYV